MEVLHAPSLRSRFLAPRARLNGSDPSSLSHDKLGAWPRLAPSPRTSYLERAPRGRPCGRRRNYAAAAPCGRGPVTERNLDDVDNLAIAVVAGDPMNRGCATKSIVAAAVK